MSRMLIYLMLCLITVTCGKKNKSQQDPDPIEPAKIQMLTEYHQKNLAEALEIRDPVNGWIEQDCDGMIPSGKYASAKGVEGVDIEAAEFEKSGRFGRRPPPRCWTREGGDQGSKTTWSRDMAAAGLFIYAYGKGRLDILERHAKYGKAHKWKMGKPLYSTRIFYTPQIIGLLYELIYAMGGEDNKRRRLPATYPKGLDDYQAHLQMMSIYLRGQVGNITSKMVVRINEHADREPNCATYQAIRGIYTGDLTPAIDIMLSGQMVCSYVRCGNDRACQLAEEIFATDLIFRKLGKDSGNEP